MELRKELPGCVEPREEEFGMIEGNVQLSFVQMKLNKQR